MWNGYARQGIQAGFPQISNTYLGFPHQNRPHISTKDRTYIQLTSASCMYSMSHESSTCMLTHQKYILQSRILKKRHWRGPIFQNTPQWLREKKISFIYRDKSACLKSNLKFKYHTCLSHSMASIFLSNPHAIFERVVMCTCIWTEICS